MGELSDEYRSRTLGELKQAISERSGKPVDSIKLLCGGKVVKGDQAVVSTLGICLDKPILFLLNGGSSPQAPAPECNLQQRAEDLSAVVTAAQRVALEMARMADSRTAPMQLTNQFGTVMNIPAADSAALSQGMLLHSRARKLIRSVQNGTCAESPMTTLKTALEICKQADAAFRRADPRYLACIDNHALLCLDGAWLLFLTGRSTPATLPTAVSLLQHAAEGFERSYGANMTRLVALKGERCAECALLARLHVLQGVAAFHSGDVANATHLLSLAQAEVDKLIFKPADVRAVKELLYTLCRARVSSKVAARAFRAGNGTTAGAYEYYSQDQQRRQHVERQQDIERRNRKYGRCADGRQWIDARLVSRLRRDGHRTHQAVEAARIANNNEAAARLHLARPPPPPPNAMETDDTVTGRRVETSLTGAVHRLDINDSNMDAGEGEGADNAAPRVVKRQRSETSMNDSNGEEEMKMGDENENERREENENANPEEENDRQDGDQREYLGDMEENLIEEVGSDDESHTDVDLQLENDIVKLYLLMCSGRIPAQLNMASLRAAVERVSTPPGSVSPQQGGSSFEDVSR